MADKEAEGLEGDNLGDSRLQDHIAHWAEVLDRWVMGIDTRLGRESGGGAPFESSPEVDADPAADQ